MVQTFTVNRGAQVITFDSPPPPTAVFGQTYIPTVNARPSGLTVTVVSTTPAGFVLISQMFFGLKRKKIVCTFSGVTATFVATGECSLQARQAGNTNYLPAANVVQTFGVGLAPQTISITTSAPTSAAVGGPGYTPAATATVMPVVITVDASASSICSISGGLVRGKEKKKKPNLKEHRFRTLALEPACCDSIRTEMRTLMRRRRGLNHTLWPRELR